MLCVFFGIALVVVNSPLAGFYVIRAESLLSDVAESVLVIFGY